MSRCRGVQRLWRRVLAAVRAFRATPEPTLSTEDAVSDLQRIELPRAGGLEDPAFPAGHVPVVPADAVAELAFPTGNPDLDFIHSTLIDCVQNGYLKAVRDDCGVLRFGMTRAGQDYVNRFLGLE